MSFRQHPKLQFKMDRKAQLHEGRRIVPGCPSLPDIQGEIRWDDGKWRKCSLTNRKLVQKYVQYATIVYNCSVLANSEERFNHASVVFVNRCGEDPYITWTSLDFHEQLFLKPERCKQHVYASARTDAPVSNIWEIQPWDGSNDVIDRAASENRRCLYILDVTQLVPIFCFRDRSASPLRMRIFSWRLEKEAAIEIDTVGGIEIHAATDRMDLK